MLSMLRNHAYELFKVIILYLLSDKNGVGQKAEKDKETSLVVLQIWKPASNE